MQTIQERAKAYFSTKKINELVRPTSSYKDSCAQTKFLISKEGFSSFDNDEVKTIPCTVHFFTLGFYAYIEVWCGGIAEGSKVFCAHYVSAGSCREFFEGVLTFACEDKILDSYDFNVTSTDGEDKSVCVSWGKFGFAEFSCARVYEIFAFIDYYFIFCF
jgi:hypothetical protein